MDKSLTVTSLPLCSQTTFARPLFSLTDSEPSFVRVMSVSSANSSNHSNLIGGSSTVKLHSVGTPLA